MSTIFDGYKDRSTAFIFTDPVTEKKTTVTVDCTIKLATRMKAVITEYPVEKDKTNNSTDHIQPGPIYLEIEGFVSESPSQKLLGLATAAAKQAILSTGKFKGLSATFASAAVSSLASAAVSRSEKFDTKADFRRLLSSRSEVDTEYPKRAALGYVELFKSGTVFDIRSYFSSTIYRNVAIESFSFTNTSRDGDSLTFNMVVKKINVVESLSQTPSEIRMADPAGTSAAEEADLGKLSKEAAPGSTAVEFFGLPGA
jgi:hypothetical protein